MLARDRAQGVFSQTFTEFSSRMISAYRLKQGAANLKKYADVFARAEQQFGVPGPVIAAATAMTAFGALPASRAASTAARSRRRPTAAQIAYSAIAACRSSAEAMRTTSTADGSARPTVLPATRVTCAPRCAASRARAYPCLPELRFVR